MVDNWTFGQAPLETPIIGLKELPISSDPLPHTHIQFAHCYKEQGGWAQVLERFIKGNGLLYDLEFLQNEQGRRVAAFGFHAGFAGSAVACLALAKQVESDGKERLGELFPYPNEAELVKEVKEKFAVVESKLGRNVRALVIGAKGRCGSGAVQFLQKVGLADEDILQWDMAETAKGGPFQEIIDGALSREGRRHCSRFVFGFPLHGSFLHMLLFLPFFVLRSVLTRSRCTFSTSCSGYLRKLHLPLAQDPALRHQGFPQGCRIKPQAGGHR